MLTITMSASTVSAAPPPLFPAPRSTPPFTPTPQASPLFPFLPFYPVFPRPYVAHTQALAPLADSPGSFGGRCCVRAEQGGDALGGGPRDFAFALHHLGKVERGRLQNDAGVSQVVARLLEQVRGLQQ